MVRCRLPAAPDRFPTPIRRDPRNVARAGFEPWLFHTVRAFTAIEAGRMGLNSFCGSATPAVIRAQRAVLPKNVPLIVVGGIKPDTIRAWIEVARTGSGSAQALVSGQSPAVTAEKAHAYMADCAMMRPLKIAIIGFARSLPTSTSRRSQPIRGSSWWRHQAVPGRASHRCSAMADAAWRSAGPRAVAITTPPSVRTRSPASASSGVCTHLLEKPPTDTLGEIEDLACLGEDRAITLFTTWHAQHNSAVAAAAKALARKRIAAMDIHWHEDVRKWHPGQRWIWEPGGSVCSIWISTPYRSRPGFSRHLCCVRGEDLYIPRMRRRDRRG